jgi:hypothetical protein
MRLWRWLCLPPLWLLVVMLVLVVLLLVVVLVLLGPLTLGMAVVASRPRSYDPGPYATLSLGLGR